MTDPKTELARQSFRLSKGLDLKIEGTPRQEKEEAPAVKKIAVLGCDFPGLKPSFLVKEGDKVKIGQVLFVDKKTAGVQFVSPAAGKVSAIFRGERRVFQSLVIEVDKKEAESTFKAYKNSEIAKLTRETIRENLLASGQWVFLKTRPYSHLADPATVPHSLFVTVMDTNPHAPATGLVLKGQEQYFTAGLQLLSKLTDGKTYVVSAPEESLSLPAGEKFCHAVFAGPHPAGLPGTHIHFLDPVHRKKTVWQINYQDVIAIGHLFLTGKIMTSRLISLAGPAAKNPRLLQTRLGASLEELCQGEAKSENVRVVSGSLLSGRTASGPLAFLGAFHQQVSLVEEYRQREFLGWLGLGLKLFSVKNLFVSSFLPRKSFHFTTSLQGSHRAMVPVGSFEKVMPLDILPTFLLRSLLVNDTERAEELGALELDEEDLALCTFVSPGKDDFGPILRNNLIQMEKEG